MPRHPSGVVGRQGVVRRWLGLASCLRRTKAFSGGAGADDVANLLLVLQTGGSFESHQVQLQFQSLMMQQLDTKIQHIRTNVRQ